jgi:hypothetical protein
MPPLPHFDPTFTYAALISLANFVSIWLLFFAQSMANRSLIMSLRQSIEALELAKAHAAAAASVSQSTENRVINVAAALQTAVATTADQIAASEGKIIGAAADVATALAMSTPTHTVLPAELQRVVVVGKKVPSPLGD